MVIVLNPNDLVKIKELQNKYILNFKDYTLCKSFPLWIPFELPLSLSTKSLKELSKEINKITIDSPLLDKNLSKIICPVKISCQKKEIKSYLPFIEIIAKDSSFKKEAEKILKKIKAEKQDFPMELSVFRLGLNKELSSNSFSLEDSVWVKLKLIS